MRTPNGRTGSRRTGHRMTDNRRKVGMTRSRRTGRRKTGGSNGLSSSAELLKLSFFTFNCKNCFTKKLVSLKFESSEKKSKPSYPSVVALTFFTKQIFEI